MVNDADTKLLSHLQMAGEFLRDGKTAEANQQIAHALRLAPKDVRALNLLGLLHFQKGRVDEAHTVYARLVTEHPGDMALRLNLGLCELRQGQPDQAVLHLGLVARSEPDNLRAQSYYGLSLFRAGRLTEARPVLIRAGQQHLVAEIDTQLGTQPPEAKAVAKGGLSASPPRVAEPIRNERPLVSAPALADVLASAAIGETPSMFSVTSDGLLLIRVAGQVLVRGEGVLATVGVLDFVPTGEAESTWGDSETPFFLAEGRGELLLTTPTGRFVPISLADGESLYLRTSAFVACALSVIPKGPTPNAQTRELGCVLLQGPGDFVLHCPSVLHALAVRPGQTAYLDEACLLGWTAGLAVSREPGTEDTAEAHLVCVGHGHVLLSKLSSRATTTASDFAD